MTTLLLTLPIFLSPVEKHLKCIHTLFSFIHSSYCTRWNTPAPCWAFTKWRQKKMQLFEAYWQMRGKQMKCCPLEEQLCFLLQQSCFSGVFEMQGHIGRRSMPHLTSVSQQLCNRQGLCCRSMSEKQTKVLGGQILRKNLIKKIQQWDHPSSKRNCFSDL